MRMEVLPLRRCVADGVWQLGVQVAFLPSKVEGRDVHAKTAPGQEVKGSKTSEPMIYKLKCSLYGLAQSPVL